MSKGTLQQCVILEWSPSHVSAFDPVTRTASHGETVADLSHILTPGRHVVVAAARRSTFIKKTRVPNASPREIEMVLATQMAGLFPVPLSELAYSFRLTNDVDEHGRLAIVAAMRAVELRELHAQARALGFRVQAVVPAALGSAMLAESLGIRDCALVQRTPEGLAIDLVESGELRYSRTTGMPSAMALVDAEVSRTYAAAALSCAPTVVAGGLTLPEADRVVSQSSLEALSSPNLERMGLRLELQEIVQAAARKRDAQRVRSSVLILLASILMASYVWTDRTAAARAPEETNRKWAGILAKERRIRDAALAKVTDSEKLQATVARAFEPAQPLEDVITVAVNYAPPGLWLTSMAVERGKPLTLRGIATSAEAVPAFMDRLSHEARFREVTLVFTSNSEIEKTPVVQFSISAFPVGNLPLVDQKTKKKVTSK